MLYTGLKWVVIACFILVFIEGYPQLSFKHSNTKLTNTQGTGPGMNVHCGVEDNLGHLWFGTTGEGIILSL